MSDTCGTALALAFSGTPTFPAASNKRPCCEGGFKAASADADIVARLFADPRAALIGMPTGEASGCDVLDIDVKNGGLEWWEANKHRIAVTRVVHTRSGGLHVYFRHAPGLRNSASRIAPGVDIRSEGGYVIRWDAHGLYCNGEATAAWPTDLLIEAMRRQYREGAAPAPEELAPPSAADLLSLLRAMPNPESTTRDEYVAVFLSVQGCLRALDATGAGDPDDAEDIREAAADWAARWESERASDAETELARWESDWSLRTNDISGWRHLIGLADQFGMDTGPWRHAAAVAEFGELPAEPEPARPTLPAVAAPASTYAGDEYWHSKLLQKGKDPAGNLANTRFALHHAPEWQGVFRLDRFANSIVMCRQPPFHSSAPIPRVLADADAALTTIWMQEHEIPASMETVGTAIYTEAREHSFSPLEDYLNGLAHDGESQIDTWLIDYLGAADTPLHRAFGAKFLISAVARAFKPGCQVDTMLVLEGRQGLMKSTALRTLFSSPWFTDHIPDLHNKDAALQIQGIWCLEHAEMATLNRTDSNRVKAFISQPVDRFRPPFGKLTANFPRQCVFAATVNPNGSGYLKDETGARRFWPVECGVTWPATGRVDIAALAEVRDSLWAEAVARYRQAEPWWLENADLEAAQVEVADARYDDDAWTAQVANFLEGKGVVRVAEVLSGALSITPRDQSKAFQMRVGGILRALKWRRKRVWLNGGPNWIFVSPRPVVEAEVIDMKDDIAALY